MHIVIKRSIPIVLMMIFACSVSLFAGGDAEEKMDKEMMDDDKMAMMGPIVVASKLDTEAVLLGTVIRLVLEANGFETEDRTSFGTTDVIRQAIISGEIDIYPEYTGNGAFFYPGQAPDSVWKDPQGGYDTIKRLDADNNDLVWLQQGHANNTWAIAVREDLARAEGLATMDDMGAYIRNGGYYKLAACEEFVTRPDVLPAFQDAYNFTLVDDQLITFAGCETSRTEQAAYQETDGVNAAMAFGTDAQISAFGLRVMVDNKNVQPIYEPAPLIRRDTLEQHPEIADILNPVFDSFDLETLQRLNGAIAVDGLQTETVARDWLSQNGFL